MPFYPMSRRTKTCFSFRFLEKRTDFYGKACRAPVRKLFLCPAGGLFRVPESGREKHARVNAQLDAADPIDFCGNAKPV
jgi:hypothetical protein